MKRIRKSIPLLLLAVIFIIGVSIRFVGLADNPVGLVDDEAENGYDAYSLLLTGKDQWGAPWPSASFRGFGDYRLPAYTYLTILPVSLFGLTPFAVRFPSALFGSLTIPLVYLLAKELFLRSADRGKLKVEILAVLAAFLLAVSPWHIGMSRVAIEQAVSVFFTTAGLLLLLKGRENRIWIVGSGIVFGLSLFVYRPNIVLVPFLILTTLLLFRKFYVSCLRQIALAIVCLLLVASPILLSAGGSAFGARTKQVNLTNDTGTIDLVNEKRGSCEPAYPDIVCKIVFNKYSAFASKFVTNYLYHFSPNLLSVYGTVSQYSILPARGLLYLVDYPLFLVAIVVVCSSATPARLLLLGLLLFSAIPDSFTSDGHYGRFFISFPAWPILISLGLVTVLGSRKKWKLLFAVIVIMYCASLSGFLVEYWTFFPYRYSVYSHYGYEELTGIIEKEKSRFDRVIVSARVHDSKQYINYLFYTKYDPVAFQSGIGIEKTTEENGWVRVKRIGTVEFLPTFPAAMEISDSHILLIGDPTEFPKKIPVVFTIQDLRGNIIFQGVDSRILYPTTKAT